ncbi:glycogen debranching protein GlgX [Acerihabitans arboris]|uniref:Glycogen debranching protein GlgX n=1 Tax=Acerihabitans arboris TaxID=2691583 RepID=A0A845STR4_9GAMM|nr:glycogen debranching protein GlgX [Acerihabitans arboris]NDL64435.1 glycogen debranching protein GlgX [Acerihabitans arboris]
METLSGGSADPMGASFDGKGVNFSLLSAHAERVVLCLFDEKGHERQLQLAGRTGNIRHGYLPGAKPGQRYGYRIHGPFEPARGLRFNPAKLLIDPCARALEGAVGDHPSLYDPGQAPDCADSAPAAPKSLVVDERYDWRGDRPPATSWGKTVIYEAHVRGLTRLHPGIPAGLRGSYAALAHPVMIAYLRELGITAVELLPVQQHVDEPRLQRLGLRNYWGYNVLAPYAVEPGYASGHGGLSALDEFRAMVMALHLAGIEVILDVVFNHSAELDLTGPVLSMRGIDNPGWYWLDERGDYQNWTGCGNTLRLDNPDVAAWVLDCLRFWREACHVDGFRFDLGTVLGRTPEFTAAARLFAALNDHPSLNGCKLIAEPWDIGPGGYQVGRFPPPFAEWNDRFRDDMRRFWLKRDLAPGVFARRFAASSDLFHHEGRLPCATVNMLTAHDGFTLQDVVSFGEKHNLDNGEDNRDGAWDNHSDNHGHEGLDAGRDVRERRSASQRALLATLLLSQGTPMLLAGDEFGHSQQGNNNAYCQDNELTWLDWQRADAELTRFTAGLIRLRQRIPALVENRWWPENDPHTVEWLDEYGKALGAREWEQGEHRLQIRLSQDYLFVINATTKACEMTLPEGRWTLAAPFQQPWQSGSARRLPVAAQTVNVLVKQR